jgi:AcrR family transcriptional regulator
MATTAAKTKQAPVGAGVRPLRADAKRNREQVLEAARQVFAKHGLDAQMDEIAQRARLGVGTVYRHFPTKRDLLEALAEKRFEWLAERARQALAEDDAGEAFRNYLRDACALQAKDLALSEAMAGRPEMMGAAAEAAGMNELMSELVGRAQKQGSIRKDISGEDIPMFVCSLSSVTKAGRTLPFMRWERLLEILLDGLSAPGATKLPS